MNYLHGGVGDEMGVVQVLTGECVVFRTTCRT